MTPILYEKDEIDFTSQGLGSLVEIYDVDVEEQRNGLLQLTASYPVSGVRYADISVGRIILAKPNQRDDVHAFRIVSTELDVTGYSLMIEADSITYDLNHNIVKHLNVSGADGQTMMSALKNAIVNPSIFTFYSDITHVSSTSLDYVNPMEAIMGVKGSFLQIWGGELKRENRRVAMFNRRGRDNVATFRLGKNISGLKYSVDISSLVTRIIPTKSVQNDDQTTTTLEGTPVDSQYINNYEQIYTLPLEFTDDTIKTVADLNEAAKGWFTKSANTGRDKPTVTIDIDVLSLQDSADYQDKFKNLESVSLTDTVTVYVPEYGVNVTAIVNELHYDPILDRVTKMTVGTAKQSFADSSRTRLSDLQDKIISVQNQADAVAVSANGKSTNYYGSVEPSHPQKGDAWFWVNGDKSGIKVFVNGDWVEPVDSDTKEKIAAAVTDAVTQAKAHTDEVKQGLSSDIATANSQAASLASTAEANAKSEATSLFNRAQNALSDAKTDLTKSISSEASKAVAAANLQAQAYVNQAKSDITDTINAFSVGGRNLFLGTKDFSGSNWENNGNLIENVYQGLSAIQTTTAWGGPKYNNSDLESRGVIQSVNDTFVMSAWVRNTGTTPVSIGFFDGFTNNHDHLVADLPAKSGWIRISSQPFQFTQTSNLNGTMRFEPRTNPTDGYVQQVGLKLEKGTIATDWTPAPEDVVLDYTTKDNKIKETISQYQETNDGHVSKLQTSVKTALEQIGTKISQTDFNQKTGELLHNINEAKDTADKSLHTIADIQEADGKRDSRISEVEKTAGEIKSTVSDLSTAHDKQSGYISTLQQRADGFDTTVTKVDNLAVGGRNLLLTSNTMSNTSSWESPSIKVGETYQGMNISANAVAWAGPKYRILNLYTRSVINEHDSYTYSAFVRNTSDTDIEIGFYGVFTDQNGILITKMKAHTDWTRLSVTFKFKNLSQLLDITSIRFEPMYNATNGYVNQSGFKLEKGTIATDWTPAPEDVQSDIAQVKITAEGINKFVRDSSGNISSDFQTALSKTSLITGSTLASSIQKQTSSQISSAITDNNGKIISLINQDSSGVQIAGKNIVLDGNTTVTGDFYAKGGNFKNLNASNLTVGTLNGNQVNITNINAGNIVSGSISGANLNINLNTGQVVFQRGRIYNENYAQEGYSGGGVDINIDKQYIATSDGYSSSVLKAGGMFLSQKTISDEGKDPYFKIDNIGASLGMQGARLLGKNNIQIGTFNSSDILDVRGQGVNGAVFREGYLATIGGGPKGVAISGGGLFNEYVPHAPQILVGYHPSATGGGTRIELNAEYTHIPFAWANTTSNGANLYIASDGAIVRSSSSSKYKLDIEYEQQAETANRLLTLDPATWHDKFESEQIDKFHEIGVDSERAIDMSNRRHYGIIAEDLVKAGLEHLVSRNVETGEVEGVEYSKVGVALIPIIRDLRNRLNDQYVEIERLKEKLT